MMAARYSYKYNIKILPLIHKSSGVNNTSKIPKATMKYCDIASSAYFMQGFISLDIEVSNTVSFLQPKYDFTICYVCNTLVAK